MRATSLLLLFTIAVGPEKVFQVTERVHSETPIASNYEDVLSVLPTHTYGDTLVGNAALLWSGIYDITPGPENGVLLVDINEALVHLVVAGQGIVRTYGRKEGGGPGEMSRPCTAVWDGHGRIYVSEYGNNRISIFGTDGRFIEIIRPQHVPFRMVVSKSGELWVGQNYLRRSTDRVYVYDVAARQWAFEVGGRYDEEPYLRGGTTRFMGYPNLTQLGRNVLVSPTYPYELLEYSQKGDLVRITSRVASWYTPPEPPRGNEPGPWQSRGGTLRDIASTPEGAILVLFSRYAWNGPNPTIAESSIDMFMPDGRWLTTMPLGALGLSPQSYRITVSTDGALWIAWMDDNPCLTRFRLEFK